MFYTKRIATSIRYTGYRYSIGYRKEIHKNWAVLGKLSYGVKLFFDGPWNSSLILGTYPTDNGGFNIAQMAYLETRFGRQHQDSRYLSRFYYVKRTYFPNIASSIEPSIGIERKFTYRYLKYLSVCIEGGRGWWGELPQGIGEITIRAFSQRTNSQLSIDDFYDRNIWLGFRLSAGFWWR